VTSETLKGGGMRTFKIWTTFVLAAVGVLLAGLGRAQQSTIGGGSSVAANAAVYATNAPTGFPLGGMRTPIKLGVLGDSIANGLLTGFSNRISQVAWPTWAVYLSGGNIHMKKNAAVPGAVTSDLVSQRSNLSVHDPTHVIFHIGVNDVNLIGSGSGSFGASVTNLDTALIAELAKGKIPVLCSVAPHRSAQFHLTDRWNSELRALALLRNVPFVDLWSDAAEPGTNIWKVGYSTGDFIHPNQRGAKLLAETFLKSVGIPTEMTDQNPFLAQSFWDTNNVITNGIFLDADANAAPDHWTLTATNGETLSLLADANVRGNWAVLTKPSVSSTVVLSNNVVWTNFVASDRLIFAGRVWLSNAVAAADGGVTIGVQFNGTNANADAEFAPVYLVTNDIPRHGVFSFEGKAVTGATNAVITVRMHNMSGTLRVAQLKLVNVSSSLQSLAIPNLKIYSQGGFGLDIPVSGSPRVGINNTSPTMALDINGTLGINISGAADFRFSQAPIFGFYGGGGSHDWSLRLINNNTNVHLTFGAPLAATGTNWGRISLINPTNAPAFLFQDANKSNRIPIIAASFTGGAVVYDGGGHGNSTEVVSAAGALGGTSASLTNTTSFLQQYIVTVGTNVVVGWNDLVTVSGWAHSGSHTVILHPNDWIPLQYTSGASPQVARRRFLSPQP